MDPIYIQNLLTRPKPEKIAIVLDTSIEMENIDCINEPSMFANKKRYDHVKRAIEIFVLSKSQMNEKHEFSLLTLDDSAHMISDFSNAVEGFKEVLSQLQPYSLTDTVNLNTIFEVLQNELEIDNEELPYVLHVILIYGRNMKAPEIPQINELLTHRDVYFDAIYIHNKDPNPFQAEISDLLVSLAIEQDRKFSYYFDIKTDMTKLYQAFSLLSAHVQQRTHQKHHEDLISLLLSGGKKRR